MITLVKPTVGGDSNAWGAKVNAALDALNVDLYALRTADGTPVTASTPLVDDAVLQETLGIGTWHIEACYLVSGTAAGDIKIAWAFAGTATAGFRAGRGPSTATSDVLGATAQGGRSAAAGNTTAAITSAAPYGVDGTNISMIEERATLVVTAAGLLKVQIEEVATSGSVTMRAGSYLWCRQVA